MGRSVGRWCVGRSLGYRVLRTKYLCPAAPTTGFMVRVYTVVSSFGVLGFRVRVVNVQGFAGSKSSEYFVLNIAN